MAGKYYLISLKSLKIGKNRLDAEKMIDLFFQENIWLFPPQMPGIESLQKKDHLLICSLINGHHYILGRFKLSGQPQRRENTFKGILNQLHRYYPMRAELISKLKWQKPKPLSIVAPDLAALQDQQFSLFPKNPGLRQITEAIFERIARAGEKGVSIDRLRKTSTNDHDAKAAKAERSETQLASLTIVELFENILLSEIPNRQSELKQMIENMKHLTRLEKELTSLRSLQASYGEKIGKLEAENKRLKERLNQKSTALTLSEQMKEKYKSKVGALTLERDRLIKEAEFWRSKVAEHENKSKDMTRVKQTLHEIASLLREA